MFAMLTCIKSRCASNNYTFIGISKNLVATPQKSKAPLITIGRFLKKYFLLDFARHWSKIVTSQSALIFLDQSLFINKDPHFFGCKVKP